MAGKIIAGVDATEDILAFSAWDCNHLMDDFKMKKGLIQKMRPCEAVSL